jgi:hypothetical protein
VQIFFISAGYLTRWCRTASNQRILLEYPFGKFSLILRAAVSTAASLLYAYLALNTRESLFNIGFLLSFPLLAAGTSAYRVFALSTMLKAVSQKGEFKKRKRGGVKGLASLYFLMIAPLLLFLAVDRVLALGIVFGLIVSSGLSDLVYYMYVRYREAILGGRLYAFVELTEESGFYVWGLTLVKRA